MPMRDSSSSSCGSERLSTNDTGPPAVCHFTAIPKAFEYNGMPIIFM